MAAKELITALPETARRYIYSAYAVIGLALGATQVGFSAAEAGQPVWLVVAMAVFAFIGTALGFTAAQNTGGKPAVEVDTIVGTYEADAIPDGDGEHRAVTSDVLD